MDDQKKEPAMNITEQNRLEYFMSQNVDLLGDVLFAVGPDREIVRAFKFILKSASPVFEAMLSDKWIQAGNFEKEKIELPQDDPKAFRLFLWLLGHGEGNQNCVYLTKLHLSTEEVLELWHICKKYAVTPLDVACRQFLREMMDQCVEDAIVIFETIRGLDEEPLEKFSLQFIRDNLDQILDSESFLDVSKEALHEILMDGDNLAIDDLKLFLGLSRWAAIQCTNQELETNGQNIRHILGDIFYQIRFHLISLDDLKSSVIPAQVLTKEESDYFQLHIQMAGLTLSGDVGDVAGEEEASISKFPGRLKPRKFIGETISTLPTTIIENGCASTIQYNRDLYLTRFTVSHKLAMHSFGFQVQTPKNLPRDFRAIIMLSPQHGPFVSSLWTTGRGSPIFHVHLQEPLVLEANSPCTLRYILRAVGPKSSVSKMTDDGDKSGADAVPTKTSKYHESFTRENPSGVKFTFFALVPGPLCEIRFKRSQEEKEAKLVN